MNSAVQSLQVHVMFECLPVWSCNSNENKAVRSLQVHVMFECLPAWSCNSSKNHAVQSLQVHVMFECLPGWSCNSSKNHAVQSLQVHVMFECLPTVTLCVWHDSFKPYCFRLCLSVRQNHSDVEVAGRTAAVASVWPGNLRQVGVWVQKAPPGFLHHHQGWKEVSAGESLFFSSSYYYVVIHSKHFFHRIGEYVSLDLFCFVSLTSSCSHIAAESLVSSSSALLFRQEFL